VLCLCPTCCAKFLYGSVEADDVLKQIAQIRVSREGGTTDPGLEAVLCGNRTRIHFSERHILELQGLLKASAEE
jgi:hypothetical protein